jgi:hypothetical protein
MGDRQSAVGILLRVGVVNTVPRHWSVVAVGGRVTAPAQRTISASNEIIGSHGRVNCQPTFGNPRCCILSSLANVLAQPKASSTRLRRRWEIAGGSAIDRRTAAVGILRDIRGHGFVTQFHDIVADVVALIGTKRDRLWGLGMRFYQRQRGQSLGVARSTGRHRADDQAAPSARGR